VSITYIQPTTRGRKNVKLKEDDAERGKKIKEEKTRHCERSIEKYVMV
jgi:hypothetical protein